MAVFFRQDEIDNRRWQRAIEQQHLPIHAFGADQMLAHMSGGKAAKDVQCRAAQRMAQLQGFDLLQAIAEADELIGVVDIAIVRGRLAGSGLALL